jgi:hypothetical protein
MKGYAFLDHMYQNVICYSRFENPSGHSFGIDLDDGSSNYYIHHNLCLGCGVKIQYGYHRKVENNIIVNNVNGPGVVNTDGDIACHWWANTPSMDTIRYNIVVNTNAYSINRARSFGTQITFDYNTYYNFGGAVTFASDITNPGLDAHRITADPKFADPANGDYRVCSGSPALAQGFTNFYMDRFGYLDSTWQTGRVFIPGNVSMGSYVAAKCANPPMPITVIQNPAVEPKVIPINHVNKSRTIYLLDGRIVAKGEQSISRLKNLHKSGIFIIKTDKKALSKQLFIAP